MKSFFFTLTLISFTFTSIIAQTGIIKGVVTDAATGETLPAATVQVGEQGVFTDYDGAYELTVDAGEVSLQFSYIGYSTVTKTVTLDDGASIQLDVALEEEATLLNTATVTSGKFEKPLGEVTVSLEVIKPGLLENTNATAVDQVLEKIPGVNILDGQANIRGGSGFSYGAGSRVLLLVDDVPILQPDAGFPQWSDVPVESIEQIEVVKGAASALYGSSALNGIINIRTSFAKSEPEFKASMFYTHYDDPQDEQKKWYKNSPYSQGASLSYKRKIDKVDLVLGAFSFKENRWNERTGKEYNRANVGVRYRITDNLNIGFNSNFNKGETSSFFYWQNSTTGAQKMNRDNAAISRTLFFRYNIDPLVTYFDPVGNRHKFIGRYFNITNDVNNGQGNASQLRYGEYQFQRNFEGINLVATAGGVIIGTSTEAQLYGDTTYNSRNLAAYAQLDQKVFDRLNLSAGFRYESNRIDNPGFQWDSIGIFNDTTVITVSPSIDEEAKPVFRFGANFEATEGTFIRASWGQGYRFPTIAEKYIFTDIGGAVVTPNPALTSETGWSAEIGVKQGYKLGGFNGFIDVAGFWSEYQNMLEFSISSVLPTLFQSQNVGGTIIKGGEVTVAGSGDLFGLETTFLAGYTFIDPQFTQFDTLPPATLGEATEGQTNALFSSSNENVLKYRSRHTAKFDIQSKWKSWSLAVALFYASHQEAVDAVFESIVIKGLSEYRMENDRGYLIGNVRFAYHFDEKSRITLLVKNIMNTEYTVRPGLIEAPRNITLRLDYGF